MYENLAPNDMTGLDNMLNEAVDEISRAVRLSMRDGEIDKPITTDKRLTWCCNAEHRVPLLCLHKVDTCRKRMAERAARNHSYW